MQRQILNGPRWLQPVLPSAGWTENAELGRNQMRLHCVWRVRRPATLSFCTNVTNAQDALLQDDGSRRRGWVSVRVSACVVVTAWDAAALRRVEFRTRHVDADVLSGSSSCPRSGMCTRAPAGICNLTCFPSPRARGAVRQSHGSPGPVHGPSPSQLLRPLCVSAVWGRVPGVSLIPRGK